MDWTIWLVHFLHLWINDKFTERHDKPAAYVSSLQFHQFLWVYYKTKGYKKSLMP